MTSLKFAKGPFKYCAILWERERGFAILSDELFCFAFQILMFLEAISPVSEQN